MEYYSKDIKNFIAFTPLLLPRPNYTCLISQNMLIKSTCFIWIKILSFHHYCKQHLSPSLQLSNLLFSKWSSVLICIFFSFPCGCCTCLEYGSYLFLSFGFPLPYIAASLQPLSTPISSDFLRSFFNPRPRLHLTHRDPPTK